MSAKNKLKTAGAVVVSISPVFPFNFVLLILSRSQMPHTKLSVSHDSLPCAAEGMSPRADVNNVGIP
jgi:hypothetical protein